MLFLTLAYVSMSFNYAALKPYFLVFFFVSFFIALQSQPPSAWGSIKSENRWRSIHIFFICELRRLLFTALKQQNKPIFWVQFQCQEFEFYRRKDLILNYVFHNFLQCSILQEKYNLFWIKNVMFLAKYIKITLPF